MNFNIDGSFVLFDQKTKNSYCFSCGVKIVTDPTLLCKKVGKVLLKDSEEPLEFKPTIEFEECGMSGTQCSLCGDYIVSPQ